MCRESIVVRREQRLGGLGGARFVARHPRPRSGGDAERDLPGVVQAAAAPRAQQGRVAGLARLAQLAGLPAALRRHVQVRLKDTLYHIKHFFYEHPKLFRL